jgi:hypothetical protein
MLIFLNEQRDHLKTGVISADFKYLFHVTPFTHVLDNGFCVYLRTAEKILNGSVQDKKEREDIPDNKWGGKVGTLLKYCNCERYLRK